MAGGGEGGPLDRKSPMPLWAQLRADLLRRLDAGAFDEEFPGELELVAAYQVSRQTVSAALRELRADGVVLAERGRRPRLADRAVITQPLGTLYSLFASVESAGLRQASIIRRRDVIADGVIAGRLGLEASTPLFRVERLRLAGDEPLALDTVWLPATWAHRSWRPTLPTPGSTTCSPRVPVSGWTAGASASAASSRPAPSRTCSASRRPPERC